MKLHDKIDSLIAEHEVEFISMRYTGTNGQMHQIDIHISSLTSQQLQEGISFDGSSIAGWKAIDKSDMTLMPDLNSAFIDPFRAANTLVLFCDIIEPRTGENYAKDPRSTAKRAEEYLKQSGIADISYFGPEAEFFIFDNVQFKSSSHENFAIVDSEGVPHNSAAEFHGGNNGYRPEAKSAYCATDPVDNSSNIRAEIMSVMHEIGLEPTLHHHEVAPAQHEAGMKYDSLTKSADNLMKFKYIVRNFFPLITWVLI